jgi:hypothetical protein
MKAVTCYFAAILLAFVVTGCNDSATSPSSLSSSDSEISVLTGTSLENSQSASANRNFRAHLNVAQEVPVPSGYERNPKGQATFQLSRDGTELSYKLIVANIENVRMAHIHLAPAGATGGVVVWLYPEGPPFQLIPGRFNGVLAEGVITSESLVGGLAGESLDDLIDEIRSGNAYVNVHTEQNPPGEIRGQIF